MTNNCSSLAYLALGSNLGDSAAAIERACECLEERGLTINARAPLYLTEPLGVSDQPDFVNTVIAVQTELNPEALLDLVKSIEAELGRQKRQHWGPREIDIDIILLRDTIYHSSRLQIPHREMQKREFVLLPLSKIAPDLRHPENGKTIMQLLDYYYAHLQRDSRGARLFKPKKS